MKHLIFIISLTTLIIWNLACTKETLEQQKQDCTESTVMLEEGGRFGANPIWFQTSNSMDNALVQGAQRTHTIFNQSKIQYQKFVPTGDDAFGYLGVFHWPYWMEVLYDNDSIGVYKVSVGYTNGEAFTHYPNVANNLLKNDHPAYRVTFKMGRSKDAKNVYRNQDFKLRVSDVFYNDSLVYTDFYHPMTRLSNTADFGHKY